jgi:hypothetical protein
VEQLKTRALTPTPSVVPTCGGATPIDGAPALTCSLLRREHRSDSRNLTCIVHFGADQIQHPAKPKGFCQRPSGDRPNVLLEL